MGKLEEITQKQMPPLSTGLSSSLGGGESMDWVTGGMALADRAIQDLLAFTWPFHPRYSFHIGSAVIWGTSGTVVQVSPGGTMAHCARQHISDCTTRTQTTGGLAKLQILIR